MKKKVLFTTVFISILLWSCVLVTQVVKITKANPVSESAFDASPIITMQSPLNNATFSFSNVLLVFTLTKPKEDINGWTKWIDESSFFATSNWTDLRNKVVNVTITLDETTYCSFEVNSSLTSPVIFSLHLTNLEDGTHTVQIHTLCDGVVLEAHDLWEYAISYNASSDSVYFIVEDATPITILISTMIAGGMSATAIGFGLLFYFKKRNRGESVHKLK